MRWLVGIIVAAALLAGCGGTATRTVTVTQAPVTSPCVTMNCVLAGLPAPPPTVGAPKHARFGLDFGWRGVSANVAKANRSAFGASYLSHDPTKNWTRALVDSYHAAGLATVAVWESTATRAEDGFAAGVADARAARAQAARLGNTTEAIDFAIDCDCAGSAVLGYFEGVHSVLGARTNAYGGYSQLAYLHARGLVGKDNWQTYAWSGGRWLPSSWAPLEQYLNGSVFDHDRALRAEYGQWPYTAPKPINPRHHDWLPNAVRHFGRDHARERQTVTTWDQRKCEEPARRTVCVTTRHHLALLAGRLSFIANHGAHLKHLVKHPRWTAFHYRSREGHKTTIGGAYAQLERRLSTKNHGVVTHW